jgi:hypothetical protein
MSVFIAQIPIKVLNKKFIKFEIERLSKKRANPLCKIMIINAYWTLSIPVYVGMLPNWSVSRHFIKSNKTGKASVNIHTV